MCVLFIPLWFLHTKDMRFINKGRGGVWGAGRGEEGEGFPPPLFVAASGGWSATPVVVALIEEEPRLWEGRGPRAQGPGPAPGWVRPRPPAQELFADTPQTAEGWLSTCTCAEPGPGPGSLCRRLSGGRATSPRRVGGVSGNDPSPWQPLGRRPPPWPPDRFPEPSPARLVRAPSSPQEEEGLMGLGGARHPPLPQERRPPLPGHPEVRANERAGVSALP